MRTYTLLADANRYENIVVVDDKDWSVFGSFDGRPLRESWASPPVCVLTDEKQNKNLPKSDFPDFASHVPVFSSRAVEVLRPLIDPFGEFLRLEIDERELYAFNVTKLVDALDLDKSQYETFRDGKRIMNIRRHAFKDSVIRGLPIFKLIQLPLMHVYVSESFVDLVKKGKLIGFELHPSSEFR